MTLVLMARLAAATCVLFFSTQAASINDDQETCIAAAEQAGVDFDSFKYNVGHMIHSLTVEDVRFFFDEAFPVDNDIPTVNTNLTGPPVLPHTPSFPSKFKFPLGSTLDRILLNNDDPDAFLERGFSSLEELAHAAHMLEMLHKTSQIYKTLENIDINKVCPCLIDEEANGIIDELEYLAEVARLDDSTENKVEINDDCLSNDYNQLERQGRAAEDTNRTVATYVKARPVATYGHGKPHSHHHGNNRWGRTIHACSNVPAISDSTTWNIWKTDITKPLDDHPTQMGINAAIYFFCKISFM